MSILLKESKLVAPNHKMEIWRNFTFIVFIIIERKYLLNINENQSYLIILKILFNFEIMKMNIQVHT